MGKAEQGLTLLDLLVVVALVALLVWLVRLDQRPVGAPAEPVPAAVRMSG